MYACLLLIVVCVLYFCASTLIKNIVNAWHSIQSPIHLCPLLLLSFVSPRVPIRCSSTPSADLRMCGVGVRHAGEQRHAAAVHQRHRDSGVVREHFQGLALCVLALLSLYRGRGPCCYYFLNYLLICLFLDYFCLSVFLVWFCFFVFFYLIGITCIFSKLLLFIALLADCVDQASLKLKKGSACPSCEKGVMQPDSVTFTV